MRQIPSDNSAWQELIRQTQAGNIPQSLAISAPISAHGEIIETLSRILLGSYRSSHPDLIIIGTADKPPAIGDPEKPGYEGTCRWLIEALSLRPLESSRRLAVIESADKLNKSAGNSLLKLTEEPPSHAYLLFLMEDERFFLPTLRSRVRFTKIILTPPATPKRIPLDSREWLDWLITADNDTITTELESWSNDALETGNTELALKIEKLRQISSRKNLSLPMLCDIILLTLKEDEIEIEQILDDIREA